MIIGMVFALLFAGCTPIDGDLDEVREKAWEDNHGGEGGGGGGPTITITISTHPAPRTLIAGSISGSLSVSASTVEDVVLNYQWFTTNSESNAGGTPVSGATSASYPIPTTLVAGTYYYFCEVSATGATSVRSSVAVITVNNPGITITSQPAQNTNVSVGSITGSLTVTASVSSGGQITYQWYSNTTASNSGGTTASGASATTASFTIPTGLAAGTYYYFCEVRSAGAESVRSNVATVKAVAGISINSQPNSQSVTAGSISGSLTFTAAVTGGGALGYQWYSCSDTSYNLPSIISGATSVSYTIPTNLFAGNKYYFFCEVSATGAESVRTSVATITVNAPVISISNQPVSTSVSAGNINSNLTVTASVTGNGILNYQWYSNTTASNSGGTPATGTGATSASFAIPTSLTTTGSPYYYYCVLSSNGATSVNSNAVTVTVTAGVSINSQPASTTNVIAGSISGSLTVAASVTGGGTLSYQWYSNTTASNSGGTAATSTGATTATFTIPTSLAAGSSYYYYCRVSATGADPVASSVATVTVSAPTITITTQPTPTNNFTAGSISGSLSVAASVTGNGTLTYQWYSNTANSNTGGTAATGTSATTANYTIPTTLAAGSTNYYFCEVRSTGATSVRSNVATVSVTAGITITTQPASTTSVVAGSISGNLTVAASVTGGGTLSYQWYSNTSASNSGGTAATSTGATTTTFTIPTSLAAGSSYYYYCRVSATGADPVASSVATVTVSAPTITITLQPAPTTSVPAGSISGSLSVSASVTGNGSLTYQWYSNTTASNTGGTAITTNGTSASYTIPTSLVAGSTNYYFCEVRSTGATSVRSNVATVTVTATITIGTHPASRSLYAGNISGNISVSASVTGNGTLTYQWYSSTSTSNTGGTAISSATSASYTIPTDLTATGSPYYYFCEVRSSGATSVRSSVATITVNATIITITTQPASNTVVDQKSISGSLGVAATVTSSGTLTYQWYSNTTNSNTGGTAVASGGTSATFTIPTTLTAGTYYYFCEVRSAGATSVRSSVATVTITGEVKITGTLREGSTLTADASNHGGIGTTTYQWYKGGTDISSATPIGSNSNTLLLTDSMVYDYIAVVATRSGVSVTSAWTSQIRSWSGDNNWISGSGSTQIVLPANKGDLMWYYITLGGADWCRCYSYSFNMGTNTISFLSPSKWNGTTWATISSSGSISFTKNSDNQFTVTACDFESTFVGKVFTRQ